jgi:hypothetical protein
MKRRDALRTTGLLLGYSMSAGTIAAVMNGCKAPATPDWIPTTLDTATSDLMAELAETILPATDTPGAKDVLVHRFLDEALTHTFGPNHKAHLLSGINGFDTVCKEKMGASFMDLDGEKRLEYIMHLEEASSGEEDETFWEFTADDEEKEQVSEEPTDLPEPTEFRHYYKDLKSLILTGYFTSEKIGEEVLAYDPVPQDYDPCMPMTEDTKAWSL